MVIGSNSNQGDKSYQIFTENHGIYNLYTSKTHVRIQIIQKTN